MKSEDVIVKEKHIKWDKIFYGDDWVNNVVETIRTKDILQSVYLKRYLLRAMMAGFIIGIITVFVLSVKATHEPDLPPSEYGQRHYIQLCVSTHFIYKLRTTNQ